MSTLPQIEPGQASAEAADALADVKKALGAVPNLAKVMANSPALVRGWIALSRALGEGVLPADVRERLAIATAEYNGCEYCLSAHTYAGARVAKIDSTELEAARDAKSADPHTAALLELSDAIVRGRGTIDDATLAGARQGNVTDAEIAEVVGNIALNILTNYLNNVADTDNEWPLVTPRSRA
ncbi:carboxymuconolactone decarboxylase family protein [Amycolatopsis sp. NPDC051903]|uniref:carboxymuconolactone decarboxylase family protein n=1 Tax=Amycolatopsis sp. NPDC051903 TaxID=3363936 RepID=UPI0037BA23F1